MPETPAPMINTSTVRAAVVIADDRNGSRPLRQFAQRQIRAGTAIGARPENRSNLVPAGGLRVVPGGARRAVPVVDVAQSPTDLGARVVPPAGTGGRHL